MGKKKVLDDQKISRINFLYWVNERNLSDIAKIIGHSPPIIERHRFKTREAYESWNDKLIAKEWYEYKGDPSTIEKAVLANQNAFPRPCEFCKGTGYHLCPDVAEPILIECSNKKCNN